MKTDNKKEFIELIKKYKSITEDDIKDAVSIFKDDDYYQYFEYGLRIMNHFTGFGYRGSCTLCLAVNYICKFCVYKEHFGCKETTFDGIAESQNPKQLLAALKKRIKFMKKKLKEYGTNT